MILKFNVSVVLLVVLSIWASIEGRSISRFVTEETLGTKWAVLVAGSNGWWNYRHQVDVCHAYQLLKKGCLKDENIIVFMYDDIANNTENPRPGVIINNPHGQDVYKGVPKDYVGEDVNADNFFNVILANRSGITGGSGKVLNTGPNDHIFIYYTDHGGPGIVSMPTGFVYANDLINVLKKKHASGTYSKLIANRTAANLTYGSHVMQYGDTVLSFDALFQYMGAASVNHSHVSVNSKSSSTQNVDQRNSELFYLTSKYQDAPKGSDEHFKVGTQLIKTIAQRSQVDNSVKHLGELLFGVEKGNEILKNVRPAGQPLVDNWDCLKAYIKTFEAHCGKLTSYGKKHIRGIANICNAGIASEQMTAATAQACPR
ncbi:unnamed protein product [Withania somnifera]